MREETTKTIYDIQSAFYDKVASPISLRRQRKAIEGMNIQPGQRVLDIGVGTGLSLGFYPNNCRVVGFDLSEGMLRKAAKKVREEAWEHIGLVIGDAMRPAFPDECFDHVMVSHVITVVSDPIRLLRMVGRLVKPDGSLVIINHFKSTNRFVGLLETLTSKWCEKLGWKSDLDLNDLVTQSGLEIDFHYKHGPVDFWTTLFGRIKEAG